MFDFTQYSPYQGMGQGMFAADPAPANPQQAQPKRGMFGGNALSAIAAGLSGYNARVSPQVNENIMGMIQAQQQQKLQAQQAELANQRELQRQKDLYSFELQNPKPDAPDDYQKVLVANGIMPGSAEWAQHMKTHLQNADDPIVMTPQGPMLRSQVMGAMQPQKPLTDADIDQMSGGPAPQAPGGFPTSYPDIGPYHRY